MALTKFGNRVKQAVNKPNASAGTFDVSGSASSGGFIKVESIYDPITNLAIPNGSIVKYHVYADNLFESGRGAVDTSAHTVARTTITDTSTGGGTLTKIDFSGATATPIMIIDLGGLDAQSMYNLSRNGRYGLDLTYTSATAFGATAGCCFIEGADAAPMKESALADLTSQTGTAANFYNVFTFLSSGVLTLEKVIAGTAGSTNPPVAFAVPAGSARSKTSDPSRRFLGSLLYGATDVIRPFRMTDLGGGNAQMMYLADTGGAAPFAVATMNQTAYTAIDFSPLIPNNGTAYEALLTISTIDSTGVAQSAFFSLDGVGYVGYSGNGSLINFDSLNVPVWMPINPTTTAGLYYKVSSAVNAGTITCWGYRFRR